MDLIFKLIIAYVVGVIIVLIIVFIIAQFLSKPKQTYTSKSRMVGCDTSLPCCTSLDESDGMPTCNICCLKK